jgi:hypothetical protein
MWFYTGSGSVEEVLLRLQETQEEQDRWLLENRCGGDKRKQSADIERALEYLKDYKERTGTS